MTSLRQTCIEAMADAITLDMDTMDEGKIATILLDALVSTLTEQLIGANPPLRGQTYTEELLAVLGEV